MLDLMPMIADELAADSAVAAIVSTRVRVYEPAPGDVTKPYQALLVLVDLGPLRLRRLPVQELTVGVRAYGRTPQEARSLYDAASDAIHDLGPRLGSSNEGIYLSADLGADGTSADPGNGQPVATGTFSFIGTDRVVAA